MNWEARIDPRDFFSTNTLVLTEVASKEAGWGIPRLGLARAKFWLPFVVSNEWVWSTDELRGGRGRCVILTFFGFVKIISCESKWQS